MTINFNLKNPKNEKSLIYMKVYFNYFEINDAGKKMPKYLKYSIGETIEPKFWNPKRQRAKETREFAEFPEFNQRLDDLETYIKKVYKQMLNDGKSINPDTLRKEFELYLSEINKITLTKKTNINFVDFAKTISKDAKNGEIENSKGNKFDEKTIKNYNSTINNLLEYQEYKKQILSFSDITIDFYKSYLNWLNKLGRKPNTIGSFIKNIKVFMEKATDAGLTKNMDFRKKDFKTIREDVQNIYLTEEEIQKIYAIDLTNDKTKEHVRDIFIIGCYTGLRFSDLKQFNPMHHIQKINNEYILKLICKKNMKEVSIPIHWCVQEICDKYNNILPHVISNQKTNKHIKEICSLAGINNDISITETFGGRRINKIVKKYQLVKCHTSRRSFATNAYKAGIPAYSIMLITGHTSEKNFLKYIKIEREENALILSKNPFFKKTKSTVADMICFN